MFPQWPRHAAHQRQQDARSRAIALAPLRKQPFVIDDFALTPLLEILEDRHERASTLVTSQLPVKQWHEAIGEATLADAICDRLIHTAHRIELKGASLREAKARAKKPAKANA